MNYKKGDTVTIKDGSITRQGKVLKDGVDNKGRVRVKPDNFPMAMSISTTPNNNLYIIS